MADIVLNGSSSVSSGSGVTNVQITYTPVIGSALYLLINKTVTGTRTFSTADTGGNTWSQLVSVGGSNRESLIHRAISSGNGSITITTTVGSGLSTTFRMILLEFLNVDTAFTTTDSKSNASSTSHDYGATGLTNSSSNSLTLCANTLNGNPDALTLPSGFTQLSMGVNTVVNLYKINASSISADKATLGLTTARTGESCMINDSSTSTSSFWYPKMKIRNAINKNNFSKRSYI